MPERITADELAAQWARVKDERDHGSMRVERLELVVLMTQDEAVDRIIAALREMEARAGVEWLGNFAYLDGAHVGYVWPVPDGTGWWAYKVAREDHHWYTHTEVAARAAVERAVKEAKS